MKRSREIFCCASVIAAIIGLAACSKDDPSTEIPRRKESLEATYLQSAPQPEPGSQAGAPEQVGVPGGSEITVPQLREVPATASAEVAPAAKETGPEVVASENTARAASQRHVVKGVVAQWSPMVLFVQPGDQIVFKQMAGHETETIEGMIPDGAAGWKSKLGQEGFAVTVEVPGLYVHKCNQHATLGMIGAVVVGDTPPANLQQIEDHPRNKGIIGYAVRKIKRALEAKGGS